MTLAGRLLLAPGALLLLLASIGLFSLRDALSRQHAATKAGSLTVACIVLGAALLAGDAAWIGRAFAIIAIVWLTLPVASHVLARAALREQAETIERAAAAVRTRRPRRLSASPAPTIPHHGRWRSAGADDWWRRAAMQPGPGKRRPP